MEERYGTYYQPEEHKENHYYTDAAILVLLPVGGSIREVHAEGEESSDSGMSLEHEKTVTENADGPTI